jgi:hypothetical protein
MFDTARLDRARAVQNSDPDPPAESGRSAALAGLRTATSTKCSASQVCTSRVKCCEIGGRGHALSGQD